jgi:hypothetical protein
MLLDISPLCLDHNQPMILTRETLHPRSFFGETYHWFVCSVYGCNQYYDIGNGYCVMRDAQSKTPPTNNRVRTVGFFFIWATAAQRWRTQCGSNEECPSNKRTT